MQNKSPRDVASCHCSLLGTQEGVKSIYWAVLLYFYKDYGPGPGGTWTTATTAAKSGIREEYHRDAYHNICCARYI